ncbi:Mom family adenine methylcarbamoylation protein [Streptomyces sp. NPDC054841]
MLPIQETLPFEDLPEMPTASPWCQRWREGKHSWRHVRDGGFDARHYQVEVIPEEEPGKGFVLAHHYSRSYPAVKVQYGLYHVSGGERRLSGVAVFGVPVSTAVLTKPLPELRPYTESLECSRFVLLDECPGNAESWFLARCFDALLADGVRGIVSFADPVPRRTASGSLVMPGHVGTIYAATNAVYAGRATARTVKLLPDGTVFHDRAAQKIRRLEQGHEYAAAQLIALGAPRPRPGCDPARWLREALAAVGARNIRHRGAHRYVFRLGRTRREREEIALGLPVLRPYPKRPDPEPAVA